MSDTFSLDELHPLTRTLLEKRGIVGEEAVKDFLFPSYEKHIGDPFQIHGIPVAVDRIVDAMKKGEKIAVYSDYDCDGVPGGVLLRTFFDEIGYPVEMYIPHRHNEGYGVHNHAIDTLKEKGVTLIITIDSGITNIEEVAYGKSVGVDFIVTDHHLPITKEMSEDRQQKTDKSKKQKLITVQIVPDAIAVINSKQDACTYDDDMLCGCAVAWKLSCAILSTLRVAKIAQESFQGNSNQVSDVSNTAQYKKVLETVKTFPVGWEKWMLDLVAISTIADMVPLQKENRALAHFGLKVLRKTKRPGLLHIFNEQRVRKEFLVEDDIAFTIAPRINAASRMGDPIQAHMMLYEKDVNAAEGYARDLEDLNTERKLGVKDIVSSLVFDHEVYKNNVIVVGDKTWGPGILGLIAQNIIDETRKPVFVWGFGSSQSTAEGIDSSNSDEAILKGSCRSKGDVSVVDLMAHVGKVSDGGILEGYGGHEQAGGFSISEEKLGELSDALNEAMNHVKKIEIGSQEVKADTEITIDDINEVTYKAIEILSPFGVGNPKPIFELRNVTPLSTKWFGKKSEHFEVIYPTSRGGKIKAIQFFSAKDIEEKTFCFHR